MKIIASATVSDAGIFVRKPLNFLGIERTGDDSNFTVRLELGAFSEPPEQLIPICVMRDSRAGYVAELFQKPAGDWYVDVAVAAGTASGFRILVCSMME